MTRRLSLEQRRRRRGLDGTTFLTVFIVLLIGVPSQLVIGALGGAGSPAQVMGVCALAWWIVERVRKPVEFFPRPDPVRRAMLLFCGAVLASFVVANLRPISADELNSTRLSLINLSSWLGVLCLTSSGVPDRDRLDRLLSRAAIAGGLLALLGLIQFVTGEAWVDRISIPGLTANHIVVGITDRAGFGRPSGTAIHGIEFAVVLCMILPLTLHYALYPRFGTSRFRRFFPPMVVSAAIPLSISRSAIIGSVVVLAFMMPMWTPTIRRRVGAALVALSVLLYLTVPGLIGTITSLFTGISDDSSAQSRTDSYPLVADFVARSPWFGRGFLTFLPSYRILDNQYLGTLIDLGTIGLASLLFLFTVGIGSGLAAKRRSTDRETRHLSQALAAAVAVGAVCFGLFDAFSFAMSASLMFLILGCAGALNRLTHTMGIAGAGTTTSEHFSRPSPTLRTEG